MTHFPRHIGRNALVASATLAMTLASPALAQPGRGHHGHSMRCAPSQLSVTGQGETRIAPDMAVVQLGVTTRADGAAQAMQENSTQQRAVIDALTGTGVTQADIQTSGLSLNAVMDFSQDRGPVLSGYEASNTVSVRVGEIPRLGEVLDAIVAAGANQINGISFSREDAAGAEDEARRAAVADARHKAEILAEAAGLTLGPVLTLRDAPVAEGPRPMMRAAMSAERADVPVEAGQVSMAAQVEIEFALIDEACKAGGKQDRPGPQDDAGNGAANDGESPQPDAPEQEAPAN
jgi:uncharacterized protein YggE